VSRSASPSRVGAEHDRHLRSRVIGGSAGQRDRDIERRAAGVHPDPAALAGGEASGLAGGRAGQDDHRGGRPQGPPGRPGGGRWRPGRRGVQVHVPSGQHASGELVGPRQQPVAGHLPRQRDGQGGACLTGVVADECQVGRQRIGVDELPFVREDGDVLVGQRRPRAGRDRRQPRLDPQRARCGNDWARGTDASRRALPGT
jgi:hypothetical protein